MADDLPAGPFATWAADALGAIRDGRPSAVPCAGCTACCRAAQFVHVEPDETDTLARIPAELLFPAPHRPPGHTVLGYDERGWCPMLTDTGCSIYAHRPRTCRTYDCRVFAAAGVEPSGQPDVADRARRWRFTLADDRDRAGLAAARGAAAYLARHPELLPGTDPTRRALAALAVHALFLDQPGEPTPAQVAASLRS